jgi:hypothetical protein
LAEYPIPTLPLEGKGFPLVVKAPLFEERGWGEVNPPNSR